MMERGDSNSNGGDSTASLALPLNCKELFELLQVNLLYIH